MLRALVRTYREAFSGLPRPVWLLSLAVFVNRSGTMVLPFLALYLTGRKGFTATEAGTVLAAYGAGGMAGAWLGGWLCDRLGALRVMVLSLAATGAGFLLLGRLDARIAIYLATFSVAVVGEAFRPAIAAALGGIAAPEARTRAFALQRLAINLGMTCGPVAGGLLAAYDYGWLFLGDGLTCLAAAVLLRASFREGFAKGAGGRAAAPAGAVASARSPWQDRPYLALLFLVTVLALVMFQFSATYPLTLHDLYGFSEARIGLVIAVNTFLIVLVEMVLVNALRGFDPLRIVGLGAFLFCAGFGLLPLGSSFAFVAFTVVVWTMGEMLSLPFVEGVVAGRAGDANRGRYMGLFTLAFSIAFVLAPLLGTWIYQAYGPKVLWYGCGLVGLVLWAGFDGLARVLAREGREIPLAAAPAGPSPE